MLPDQLLEAALAYAARGWPVFPAHTPVDGGCSCRRKECDRAGKHPRTKGGLNDATTDRDQIRAWWKKWPEANLCVRTGDGLAVIDIDPIHGGDESFAELEAHHGAATSTVETITGSGGRHLFYRSSTPLKNSVSLIGPGIDVRADGGYVVAAPSLHASGRRYAWEASHDPDETIVAPMPAWLEHLATRARAPSVGRTSGERDAAAFTEGKRNSALASLAGSMRRRGMSVEAIEAALLLENATRCVPPLDETEVRRIARSVARYPAKTDPSRQPAATPDRPWMFERGDHPEIAQAVLDVLANAPLTWDEGDFWRYEPELGIWKRLDHDHVAHAVTKFSGCPIGGDKPSSLHLTDASIRGVVNVARMIVVNDQERGRFSAWRRGVAFRNGFAVVENGRVELLPHAPEHMARHAFNFDYDPKAPAPKLAQFFDELFADVTDDEAADRERMLQEFVGACLTGIATKYQMLLVLAGSGGNGKSEFLRLARGLFHDGTCASIPPQDWADRFRPARLVGVLANFVDEIPEREITGGEVFKAIITGDPVSAERKHRDPFEFSPIAGHIISANTLPGTIDQSDGFWRRLVVCPFTRDFTTVEGRKLDAAGEVLDHERPALAVWALEGAARLVRGGKYTTSTVAADTLAEWRNEADPVRRFILERDDKVPVPASSLYSEWRMWARSNGFADMSSTRFGRRVMATQLYERSAKVGGRVYTRRAA